MMSLNRREPPTIGSIAALLAMDRTTLTAALKPLERRGLIEIKQDPKDRRGRLLALTPTARRLVAAAIPVWERTHESLAGLLGESDPHRLRRDLRSLS